MQVVLSTFFSQGCSQALNLHQRANYKGVDLTQNKGPILGVAASSSMIMLLMLILIVVASHPTVPTGTTTVTQTLTTTFTLPQQTVTYTTTAPAGVEVLAVRFSPDGGCKAELLNWINHANQSIYVLIYSFTLDDVANALIAAKNRGLDVKVIMDNEQSAGPGSEYQTLLNAGVTVRTDNRSAEMHDKVAIIDNQIVITGSFNWSANADTNNNENLIVLRSPSLASTYTTEFWHIWNTWT